jgi:hypothetical protein
MAFEMENAIALGVSCPACHQPKSVMCVYTPVAMADPFSRRASVQARLARVGTPTKKAHWQRSELAQQRLRNREYSRRRRALLAGMPHASEDLLAASRAGFAWDRVEYDRLRRWYAQWGSILFEDRP